MTFTDEDLKVVKSNQRYWEARTQSEPNHLAGLIARLEAAERVIDMGISGGDHNGIDRLISAWRKAKGL